eukprot:scaffold218_cov333-Prasinococcus_capsulatus_cf.AAC.7
MPSPSPARRPPPGPRELLGGSPPARPGAPAPWGAGVEPFGAAWGRLGPSGARLGAVLAVPGRRGARGRPLTWAGAHPRARGGAMRRREKA